MVSRAALVVDDSKSARFALRKSLEAEGYVVETAEDAEEAWLQLARGRPDVVFLDHVMPGTDGLDVLSELRRRRETASLPVVICSSHDEPAFVDQARARGALDVLQKPPRPEALRRILQLVQTLPPPAPEPEPEPPSVPTAAPPAGVEPAAPAVAAALPEASEPGMPRLTQALQGLREGLEHRQHQELTQLREGLDSLRAEVRALPPPTPAFDPGSLRAELLQTQAAELDRLRIDIARITVRLQDLEQATAQRLAEMEARLLAQQSTALDALAARLTRDQAQAAEQLREAVETTARRVATEAAQRASAALSDQLAEAIVATLRPGG